MSHWIRAFADEERTNKLAELSLCGSEATVDGNIYEVLDATDKRKSCSGDGSVLKYMVDYKTDYKVQPNIKSSTFLDQLVGKVGDCDYVWIKFD